MIRILILEIPLLSNTGYWRLFRPLEVMRQLYPGIFYLTYKMKDLTYADIVEHDLIITRRPHEKNAAILVELLQKAVSLGKPVIFDEDDLATGAPDTHELYQVFANAEWRKKYVKALQCASAFWFSTPAFLQTVHPQGEVIPNAILPTDLPDGPAPDMGLFGWQGKSIQVHDLMAGWDWYEANKSSPLIKRWVFFGYKPPLRHYIPPGEIVDNTETIAYIDDTETYMASFRQNCINGMWKPLIDCPFNDHKSNINYLGATMGGGYCITNYAGNPGWEHASAELLSYEKACELWAAAKEDILKNYNLLDTARMRAQSIFALLPHFFPQTAAI